MIKYGCIDGGEWETVDQECGAMKVFNRQPSQANLASFKSSPAGPPFLGRAESHRTDISGPWLMRMPVGGVVKFQGPKALAQSSILHPAVLRRSAAGHHRFKLRFSSHRRTRWELMLPRVFGGNDNTCARSHLSFSLSETFVTLLRGRAADPGPPVFSVSR
jgi:hypothetical protein